MQFTIHSNDAQQFYLLWIGFDGKDFNCFVRLNESITVSVGDIMRHKKLLVSVDVAEASISDTVASSYFVMKLSIRSDFISIVVRA